MTTALPPSSVYPLDELTVLLHGKTQPWRAPDHPALSRRRCVNLCDWICSAYDADMFASPVDWATLGISDYPTIVTHPMDLGTVRSYAEASSDFEFGTFLLVVRLVWHNAQLYNPAGHPVHALAGRLEKLFEERAITMQRHPSDDASLRLTQVYSAFLFGLRNIATFNIFATAVDVQTETAYPLCVPMPMYLDRICDALVNEQYVNRYEIACDRTRGGLSRVPLSLFLPHPPSDGGVARSLLCLRS